MKIPVDTDLFSVFIDESQIFEKTRALLRQYLESWYMDEPQQFIDGMWADFETVMTTYHIENWMVSFNKNFSFDPPLDTITCRLTISDAEDSYCTSYKATFDFALNPIDDTLTDRE